MLCYIEYRGYYFFCICLYFAAYLKIEIHFFALGNERTLVTCKPCEVQSASQRFTCDQCPFISQCKRNIVLQSLYLC